jgi:hypothetical protein
LILVAAEPVVDATDNPITAHVATARAASARCRVLVTSFTTILSFVMVEREDKDRSLRY